MLHSCACWDVTHLLHACRFQALRDLMPTQEKMDKASFLMAAVDYIRRLQVRCGLRRQAYGISTCLCLSL